MELYEYCPSLQFPQRLILIVPDEPLERYSSRYVGAANDTNDMMLIFWKKNSVELPFSSFGDHLINILRKVNRLIYAFKIKAAP
jgi:hypothetical protein